MPQELEFHVVRLPRATVLKPRRFGETEQAEVADMLRKGGIDTSRQFSQSEDAQTGEFVYRQVKADSSPAGE